MLSEAYKLYRVKKALESYENQYVIAHRIGAALGRLRHKKPSVRLQTLVRELLRKERYLLDRTKLENALIFAQREGYFDNTDLYLLNDVIAVGILNYLSASAVAPDLENCVRTLRFLDTYDFESFFCKISRIEHILRSVPDGVYVASTKETQRAYRTRIERYARRHRMSEVAAAELLAGTPLLQEHARVGKWYFVGMYGGAAVWTMLSLWLCRWNFTALLLFVPFTEAMRWLCDRWFARACVSYPLPCLALKEIPPAGATLTVITTLLHGAKQDAPLFARLERLYLQNPEREAYFGILGDFADASEASDPADASILGYAKGEIQRLCEKYGDHFCLFVRRRSYDVSGRVYMGYERKRGAVLELVRLMHGKATNFYPTDYPMEFLSRTRYLVTLDADTEMSIGALKRMVGTMMHPENCPQVENGVVKRGYGVLQPRMVCALRASTKTPFTLLQAGTGGRDVYADATFDTYQTLFGTGIFCGKGILDVRCYDAVLDGTFGEDQILSHDLLEGSYLRAGMMVDFSFSDTCPKSPRSFFERAHRWIRGDTQALPFACRIVRDAKGQRRKNPISALARYQIWDNLRRESVPVFLLVTLGSTLFCNPLVGGILTIFCGAVLFLPFFLQLGSSVRIGFRRFFGAVLPRAWHSFLSVCYTILSLAQTAYVTVDAVIRATFRMRISHRRMLEWVTASESDRKNNSLLACYLRFCASWILGAGALIFSGILAVRLLGVAWMLFPLVAYLLALPMEREQTELSEEERQTLYGYVERMWRYYADFVTEAEHFLPPDNYQSAPVATLAHRTSPTNIGLYLLSTLAARDFSLISSKELAIRAEQTLSTVEMLPKWHGHLYNWYDTQTAELIGMPYVSTVDSGNFVTALLAFGEGIKEYAAEAPALPSLAGRARALADAADFSKLYREDRKLFSIGYDPVKDAFSENCYDLYMSEARSASYYAIAVGAVDKEHWAHLGRTLITKYGYTGLISWSGTAFEYFMPPLLLPVYADSLQEEALRFACMMQKASVTDRLFGRSESGYFHFDADMNYQYSAFGVQKLGLCRGMDRENVIAPYASFLMLRADADAMLANLRRLETIGAYGDYGFFEAVDFTPSRVGGGYAVIHSYMAHHIGMSIVAAANAIFSDQFPKRFFRDCRMAAAEELLMEPIPVSGTIYRNTQKRLPPPAHFRARLYQIPQRQSHLTQTPVFYQLANGRMRLVATSHGQLGLFYDKRAVFTHDLSGTHPLNGLRLYLLCDEMPQNLMHGESLCDGTCVAWEQSQKICHAKAALSLLGNQSVALVHLEAQGNFRRACPTLIFFPMLARETDYDAHPAFSKLSICAEYLPDQHILLYERRPRSASESPLYLAVSFYSDTPFSFSTRRDACLPMLYDDADLAALTTAPLDGACGACIDPICVIRKESVTENGHYQADFLLTVAESRREAVGLISALRTEKRKQPLRMFCQSMQAISKGQLSAAGLRAPYGRYATLLLSALYRPAAHAKLHAQAENAQLWQFGISGDLPIVLLELCDDVKEQENLRQIVCGFLRAQRYLALCGFRFDLVFLCEEQEQYGAPCRNGVLSLVRSCGGELFLGRHGGIFLLSSQRVPEYLRAKACFDAVLDCFTVFDQLYYRYLEQAKLPLVSPPVVRKPERDYNDAEVESESAGAGERSRCVQGGYFTEKGFVLLKGTQRAPWSYLYTGEQFGTLLTQNSLGYTWYRSARDGRLTPWSNDPLQDFSGEQLLLTYGESTYDLCAMASRVEYLHGNARYVGSVRGVAYFAEVGVDAQLCVKLIRVRVQSRDVYVRLQVSPILGTDEKEGAFVESEQIGDTVFYRNHASCVLSDTILFVSNFSQDGAYCFLLGAYPANTPSAYDVVREKYADAASFTPAFARYASEAENLCAAVQVQSADVLLDTMVNFYLPYQAIYVRMYARTAFYQSSGAYGFRDQLQDSIAALYYDPNITRRQILRAASRQYTEGDVLHWWHEVPILRGVRSKCADDLLWLPYVTALYLDYTGDLALLDTEIPYLESQPLGKEQERYETPAVSSVREHLYGHCMRAIFRAMRFGIHRLPLIGSGDWNDGMNRVGSGGKGESVWMGFFLQLVLRHFLPICESRGDFDAADRLRAHSVTLKENTEHYGFSDQWYLRAFYDDGTSLGGKDADGCKIDLIPQAFAAIVNGKTDHTEQAMQSAYEWLYDRSLQIFKLFAPPFDHPVKDPGYIRGYAPGLRENGGQYTHAAVWGAWGCYAVGNAERGFEILQNLNPAHRMQNPLLAQAYRLEPYALAGDIYASPDHPGRGGWSHYTGASAWFLQVFFSQTLGYRVSGNAFTFSPRLCPSFSACTVHLQKEQTLYVITVQYADASRYLLDGQLTEPPFYFDQKSHFLEITVEKPEEMV